MFFGEYYDPKIHMNIDFKDEDDNREIKKIFRRKVKKGAKPKMNLEED